jgi:hypothetical protein
MAIRIGTSTPSKLYLGVNEVTKAYLGDTEVYSVSAGPWTPADLGASLALWLDAADASTITLNGSNVSQWDDKSGNDRHASQATASFQPLYQASPARVIFDKTDDVLVTTLPATTGTMILSTPNGTAAYGVNIPSGSYQIGGRGGDFMPDNAIIGQTICNTTLSSEDKTLTIEYMQGLGGGDNYGAVTNFSNYWRSWSEITVFPLIDTSSGTNFSFAWLGCSGLTSFPLIDTSSGTNFSQSWRFCSSLTTFPANFFDNWTATPANNCFVNTWDACINLTATSVENILNSIDTSGRSAPASGVDITIDYNAGSGTPNVSTAVTNLKSRGWTITLNGVAQ